MSYQTDILNCMGDIISYFNNRHKKYPLDSICTYDATADTIILYYSTFAYNAKEKNKFDYKTANIANRSKYHNFLLEHVKPFLLNYNIDKIAITYQNQSDMKAYAIVYDFDNTHFFISNEFPIDAW